MKKFVLAATLLLCTSCVYWTPNSRQTSNRATVIPDVPMQKWDIKSCGAGSLTAVLQRYGDKTTMEEWDSKLRKTRGGVMSIDIVLAARQQGFDARLVTGNEELVREELMANRPLILMLQVVDSPGKSLDFFHYIVMDGYDPARKLYRTQFGDGKARWVKFPRIEKAWEGGAHAVVLIRPKDPLTESLRAAVELEEAGKLALAADAYRTLLDQHPESALAWTNLGNTEMRLGRRPAAEEAYRKALALKSDSADALNNLAWLLYEEKRLDEAETFAKQAVATTAPDGWTRLDTLARIQAARGNCSDALATYKSAVASVPQKHKAELEQGFAGICAGS